VPATRIASFAREPALQCLDVIENCLCLHVTSPPATTDLGVPRAEVALDPKGYLRASAHRDGKLHMESFEEALLWPVADGISGRKDLQTEVLANRGRDGCQGDQIDRRAAVRLEPVDR
jgi:hypothetical protein